MASAIFCVSKRLSYSYFLKRSSLCSLDLSWRKVSTLMKAIRISSFGGPSVLNVDHNVPIPQPNETQMLVKVRAAGINPVDVYIREQAFAYKPKLPLILGKEVAGDVVAVGNKHAANTPKSYEPGERVICCLPYDGGYAEYVVCEAADCLRLPSHVSYAEGAAIYVAYFTAYRALITKLKIQRNEVILIHGASGSVGTAAVQIAKSLGALVVGTAGTKEGKQLVQDIGADFVVNHRGKDHLKEAIALIPDKRGFDAILENQASLNLASDLGVLAPNGRIVVVGATESIKIDPRYLINTEGLITGVKISGMNRSEWEECVDFVTQGMCDGWLRPVIAKEYEMEDIQQAHEHLMRKHGHLGKLVLKVS